MTQQIAVFGAGCFWCIEAAFNQLKGVLHAESGYTGGRTANPTYADICTGSSGHAEVVKVEFDPEVIDYTTLLEVFFHLHDPTQLNRQGADVGTQYRSVIFTRDAEQRAQALTAIAELDRSRIWPSAVVTSVEPLENFYSAEDYHQGYVAENQSNPYCRMVVNPKLAKFSDRFGHLLKGQV